MFLSMAMAWSSCQRTWCRSWTATSKVTSSNDSTSTPAHQKLLPCQRSTAARVPHELQLAVEQQYLLLCVYKPSQQTADITSDALEALSQCKMVLVRNIIYHSSPHTAALLL